ncbi:nitrate reductase molybdenum cofactor assembly chaperone [Mycobacterium sp. C31M]
MRLRRSRRPAVLHHRMVWQGSALLLARPDRQFFDRVETVAEMLGHLDGALAMPLGRAIAGLQVLDLATVRRSYEQLFGPSIERDLRLTTWVAGTTREQVVHVQAFTDAYRAAGVSRPRGEAHDHLAVLLEFAANVDPEAGARLLAEHRVSIAALGRTAADAGSAYTHVFDAIGATLPAVDADEVDQLLGAAEDVGRQAVAPDQSHHHAPNGR